MTIPENDDWLYNDKPSMGCNVFVCRLYQEAEILEKDYNCTEFTPFDSTELNIYSSYEQLMGDYKINMTKYNRVIPFNNMRTSCPTVAPEYNDRNNIDIYNSC